MHDMKRILIGLAACVLLLVTYTIFFGGTPVTNPDPVGDTIICFGDSLTFGTGAAPERSYPAQLAELIGNDIINAGVPGDTTTDALARLERDVLDRSPRIVLITLGGNDLMRDVPSAKAFENLETIVRRIHDRGALVVVGGIEVPLLDRGYARAYRDLRNATGCVLIANVLDGIKGKPGLMADRIHPNGDGYAVMAKTFHKAVAPYL
jgi:acyl-CoA thioesterase-1